MKNTRRRLALASAVATVGALLGRFDSLTNYGPAPAMSYPTDSRPNQRQRRKRARWVGGWVGAKVAS